jgi:hypothetical protein
LAIYIPTNFHQKVTQMAHLTTGLSLEAFNAEVTKRLVVLDELVSTPGKKVDPKKGCRYATVVRVLSTPEQRRAHIEDEIRMECQQASGEHDDNSWVSIRYNPQLGRTETIYTKKDEPLPPGWIRDGDDEESDGGEYIPNSSDDEGDNGGLMIRAMSA